jgi:protein YibB
MTDITIVTAFFDIGRSDWTKPIHGRQMPHYIPRSTDTYFGYFENLAKIKNDMIIYTSADLEDRVKDIRSRNAPDAKTIVKTIDFQETVKSMKPKILSVMQRKEFVDMIIDPHMPEYWNADYVLVNYMKTDFIVDAFETGLIDTELAAWIDFGYARNDKTIPSNGLWKYSFDPAKMHYFNKQPINLDRPIFDVTRHNDVYIMGCHMVGGRDAWKMNLSLNQMNLSSMLNCGFVDDDQTILLMNYRTVPDKIELHPIDADLNGWYVAMLNFNEI